MGRIGAVSPPTEPAVPSPRTVAYARAILRRALGQALKWGLIACNPVPLVDAPKQRRHDPAFLAAEEAKTVTSGITGDREQGERRRPLVRLRSRLPDRAGHADRRSEPYSPNPAAARAGVRSIPFHDLRHSAATLLLARGLTPGQIQKILRHATVKLTEDLYWHHVREIADRAAAEMEALLGSP